jgi:hypothetical protein
MITERRAEFSHPHFRSLSINPAEIRATSTRSRTETAGLLSRLGMVDVRQLGCPDDVFEETLELNIAAEGRSRPNGQGLDLRTAMQLRLDRALKT